MVTRQTLDLRDSRFESLLPNIVTSLRKQHVAVKNSLINLFLKLFRLL